MLAMDSMAIYNTLLGHYGTPPWWSDDPYVVMVQSILVQNTTWNSVLKVSETMGERLSPDSLLALPREELQELIRPCGFPKAKSAAILRLTQWYRGYGCCRDRVGAKDTMDLRKELLSLKGIGEETADVILVYAFHKPSFVVDAYTRRFLSRLGMEFPSDQERRAFLVEGIPSDYLLYGHYHWLLLEHGKAHCGKKQVCEACPFEHSCSGKVL